MATNNVGNIFKGDQIAFRDGAKKLLFGTVAGFGYTENKGLVPYLKIAEYPQLKVLVPQVEKITNKCRSK